MLSGNVMFQGEDGNACEKVQEKCPLRDEYMGIGARFVNMFAHGLLVCLLIDNAV